MSNTKPSPLPETITKEKALQLLMEYAYRKGSYAGNMHPIVDEIVYDFKDGQINSRWSYKALVKILLY